LQKKKKSYFNDNNIKTRYRKGNERVSWMHLFKSIYTKLTVDIFYRVQWIRNVRNAAESSCEIVHELNWCAVEIQRDFAPEIFWKLSFKISSWHLIEIENASFSRGNKTVEISQSSISYNMIHRAVKWQMKVETCRDKVFLLVKLLFEIEKNGK
jgi:hypothetical protein